MRTPDDLFYSPDSSEEQSQMEHIKEELLQRKKQIRAKLILLNAATALIVIMIVLVFKIVSLNTQDSIDSLQAAEQFFEEDTVENNSDGTENNSNGTENNGNGTENTATSTSEPAVPVQAQTNGKEQWIRKDLDKDKPMVALTFDDGPYTPVTERILSTLKKYNQKATFFCVGNRISKYSQSVLKAYRQGCQIGSHTYGHVILTKLKKEEIREQIDNANLEVQKVIGCQTTILRPTGGLVNEKVRNVADVPMICWSVDSEDWKSRDKKQILERCENIRDGDIVLMHDLYSSTADAVEKLVPQLKKKGYLMVTIDELFYYKGITLENDKVYYSGK